MGVSLIKPCMFFFNFLFKTLPLNESCMFFWVQHCTKRARFFGYNTQCCHTNYGATKQILHHHSIVSGFITATKRILHVLFVYHTAIKWVLPVVEATTMLLGVGAFIWVIVVLDDTSKVRDRLRVRCKCFVQMKPSPLHSKFTLDWFKRNNSCCTLVVSSSLIYIVHIGPDYDLLTVYNTKRNRLVHYQ